MRAVLQRVKNSSVTVNGETIGEISAGITILLGIKVGDSIDEVKAIASKCVNLRIFDDENGVMNLSAIDTNKEILIVSNFTIYADCKKGRRPSYKASERPEIAENLYKLFIDEMIKISGLKIETGSFGAEMQVNICNDGPITIVLDSEELGV